MEKCRKLPIEKLIEYCDGELPQKEAGQIEQHIAGCEICKANVNVLQNSLTLAQNVWQSEKEKWGNLRSFNKHNLHKLYIIKIASVAAAIILTCSASLIYLFSKPNIKTPVPAAKEIELQAERAAIAAQLLAVGDMYAAQAGAEKYAVERYNDLIESFPSSPQSEQAKLNLQKILERKIQ